jgi:TubC N-terminal docking domain
MTTHELLADLRKQGFQLTPLPGDRLEVRPFSKLSVELREQLQQRKAEILALITQKPDYRALYEDMVRQVPEDMPLVDYWLCDSHPDLWAKIRT